MVMGMNGSFLDLLLGTFSKCSLLKNHDFTHATQIVMDVGAVVEHLVNLIEIWCRSRKWAGSLSLVCTLAVVVGELVHLLAEVGNASESSFQVKAFNLVADILAVDRLASSYILLAHFGLVGRTTIARLRSVSGWCVVMRLCDVWPVAVNRRLSRGHRLSREGVVLWDRSRPCLS